MVRGNKFKPAGAQSVTAAAVAAEATVAGKSQAGQHGTAQPHSKQRNDAAHPAKGQDHEQPASKQTHAARDAAAKQPRRNTQGPGQTSSAQAAPAQHADACDPSGVLARGDGPLLSGGKRRRPESGTAAGAVSGSVAEAVSPHSAGAPQAAAHGPPHAQHKRRQRYTKAGAGQQHAAAGGQGAPSPASASAAEQRAEQHTAEARPQHARKKRRLRAGADADAGAATVTINGVEVRTIVAAPPKGETSGCRGYLTPHAVVAALPGSLQDHCASKVCMGCMPGWTAWFPCAPCVLRIHASPLPDAPRAAVSANWLAMKAAISLPAPFKRQGSVISTAAPAPVPAPAKGPEARGADTSCSSAILACSCKVRMKLRMRRVLTTPRLQTTRTIRVEVVLHS